MKFQATDIVPQELENSRRRIRQTLGLSAQTAVDQRRGFDQLHWPCPWDSVKPFELSLEYEVRLQPNARGSGEELASALELCKGHRAELLLPDCSPVEGLTIFAEDRDAGAQSEDAYYDDCCGATEGIIRRGFTFRERYKSSKFMTWGSDRAKFRPFNAELPSCPIGVNGLTSRLEFNWREREGQKGIVPTHNPLGEDHPMSLLATEANLTPSLLVPLLRNTTVRRKFNFCSSEGNPVFVVNLDWITCETESVIGGHTISFIDIDLSALSLASATLLNQLDEIASALNYHFNLVPNPHTKAGRALVLAQGLESAVTTPRIRYNVAIPKKQELNLGLVITDQLDTSKSILKAISQTPGCRLWSSVAPTCKTEEAACRLLAELDVALNGPSQPSLETFLADTELDAVVIAPGLSSPTSLANQAMEAGLHVLCMAPIAPTTETSCALWVKSRISGLVLAGRSDLRFSPAHFLAADICRTGQIGRIQHASARCGIVAGGPYPFADIQDPPQWWASAVIGSPWLDLVRWMLLPTCGDILRLHRFSSHANWHLPLDETSLYGMEFTSGATADLLATVSFHTVSRLELTGTTGSVVCIGGWDNGTEAELYLNGERILISSTDPHQLSIANFLAAIQEGIQPEVGAIDAARNVQLHC